MNRRSLLRFIGLAPVAAVAPKAAVPCPTAVAVLARNFPEEYKIACANPIFRMDEVICEVDFENPGEGYVHRD